MSEYRVQRGEQGVFQTEPYSQVLGSIWRFRTPEIALDSSRQILRLFYQYKKKEDFVGMDVSRKFLQMGFTRSMRYAHHRSGRKYADDKAILTDDVDSLKAKSAAIFKKAWDEVESDVVYADMKLHWRVAFG